MSKKTWRQKIREEKEEMDEELDYFKKRRIHTGLRHTSWREKNIFDNGDRCYQVMGKDTTGRTAWYFILINKSKVEKFLRHKQGDSYDLADYGKIIASDYGEEVPADVKAMLKEKYDFDNF